MANFDAILIDPVTKQLSRVTVQRGKNELKDIYGYLHCRIFETVSPSFGNDGDRIIADEEALFSDEQTYFYANGQKITGRGLYVGSSGGRFASPEMTIDELAKFISFERDDFRTWIDTFLEEKDVCMEHSFNFDYNGGFIDISLEQIIEQVCISDADAQKAVKHYLVQIDSANRDVMHFFKFLGRGMADKMAAEHPKMFGESEADDA